MVDACINVFDDNGYKGCKTLLSVEPEYLAGYCNALTDKGYEVFVVDVAERVAWLLPSSVL